MSCVPRRALAVSFALVLAMAATLRAVSGVQTFAPAGAAVPEDLAKVREWPAGTLELVNDPLRTAGHEPWSSGSPSDQDFFDLRTTTADELNGLVAKLSRIDAKTLNVVLSPERSDPPTVIWPAKEPATTAVFSIGSQPVLDRWFKRLPNGRFGKQVYTEPPKAHPPTLTIYAGHPAVDLSKVRVPMNVDVTAGVKDARRAELKGDPVLEAIDRFVAEHQALREVAKAERASTQPGAETRPATHAETLPK
jgi:hypothetical protein